MKKENRRAAKRLFCCAPVAVSAISEAVGKSFQRKCAAFLRQGRRPHPRKMPAYSRKAAAAIVQAARQSVRRALRLYWGRKARRLFARRETRRRVHPQRHWYCPFPRLSAQRGHRECGAAVCAVCAIHWCGNTACKEALPAPARCTDPDIRPAYEGCVHCRADTLFRRSAPAGGRT